MNGPPPVTQKWLLRILVGVVLAGGAGWMTQVHSEIAEVKGAQQQDTRERQEIKRDAAVMSEKVDRLREDVQEIKADQREQGKKLDELLRRVR